MREGDEGQAGVALAGDLGQSAHRCFCGEEPADPEPAQSGEIALVLAASRLAVPAVVVGDDGEPDVGEEARERLIAQRVLPDAVRDLHDADRFGRAPLVAADLDTVCVDEVELDALSRDAHLPILLSRRCPRQGAR